MHNSFIDSIWGNAIIDLKDAYAEIHFLRKKETFSDEEFIKAMIIFCNTLKKIFDRKTKANCSVSIKVPAVDISALVDIEMKNLEVRNLCRDTKHNSRDTKQYSEIKHTIIGNTPYVVIVNKILKGNQKSLAYINNDIDKSKDYLNTSIECYQNGMLPYKSELVYPIVPIKGNDNSKKQMKGFICIDCDKKDKFDEKRYDVPMVQGIADGIYDIFTKRNDQQL